MRIDACLCALARQNPQEKFTSPFDVDSQQRGAVSNLKIFPKIWVRLLRLDLLIDVKNIFES